MNNNNILVVGKKTGTKSSSWPIRMMNAAMQVLAG